MAFKDLVLFSTIVSFVFVSTAFAFFMLFGQSLFKFHTMSLAIVSLYQMILGQFEYTSLYDANPHAAGAVFTIFVFFFIGFVIPMYTAIIIRNYNRLMLRKSLLSAGMARIVYQNAEQNLSNYFNLLTFRRIDPNQGYKE